MRLASLTFLGVLIASSIYAVAAQSVSSFPAHCLPRIPSDPALDPQSCAIALNQFNADNQNATGLFTNNFAGPGTLQLPWDRTYMDCRLRIEMLYAQEVNQSVHDVWAQGQILIQDCVFQAEYVGGRIFVDDAGLTISLRPVGDDGDWEERFNSSSVVVGQSGRSNPAVGTTEITA